jgi:hypothetical protein
MFVILSLLYYQIKDVFSPKYGPDNSFIFQRIKPFLFPQSTEPTPGGALGASSSSPAWPLLRQEALAPLPLASLGLGQRERDAFVRETSLPPAPPLAVVGDERRRRKPIGTGVGAGESRRRPAVAANPRRARARKTPPSLLAEY